MLRRLDEFTRNDAPADGADLDGLEFSPAEVFEPVIAREQIHDTVAVNVSRRRAFSVFEAAAFITAFPGLAGINGSEWPGLGVARVSRDIRDEKRFRALVPKDELRCAGVLEIAEHLVVVLRFSAFLDHMPLPRDVRIEIRIRIFPPPKLVTLPVAAENDVEIAIPVNVIGRAPGFNGEKLLFQNVTVPALARASIPDKRWRDLAEADDKIFDAVRVEVSNEIPRLLR